MALLHYLIAMVVTFIIIPSGLLLPCCIFAGMYYIVHHMSESNLYDGKILSKLEIETELYRFDSVIGKGAFGIVYKCRRKPLGIVVAIKKIESKNACWNEMKILEKLCGSEYEPYFVQCLKIHRTDVNIYLVMEYCPNGSLHEYILKRCFDADTANRHFIHLIEGLRKMHGMGLMHRDLKPGNILVARNRNNDIILKIADFGVSKDGVSNLAIYQTTCGTPCYMAPEVLQSHRYDKAADVYSLGGIRHFMTRKQHPGDLSFDKCGYPTFYRGHRCIHGRMLCQRRDERLKLEEIVIRGDEMLVSSSSTDYCAKCGQLLHS